MRNKRTILAVSGCAAAFVLAVACAFANPPTARVLPKGCLFQLWTEQVRCDVTVAGDDVTIEVKNFALARTHPYYVTGGRQSVGSGTLTLNGVQYDLERTSSGLSVTVPASEWEQNFSSRLVVNDTDGKLIVDDSLDWEYAQP